MIVALVRLSKSLVEFIHHPGPSIAFQTQQAGPEHHYIEIFERIHSYSTAALFYICLESGHVREVKRRVRLCPVGAAMRSLYLLYQNIECIVVITWQINWSFIIFLTFYFSSLLAVILTWTTSDENLHQITSKAALKLNKLESLSPELGSFLFVRGLNN